MAPFKVTSARGQEVHRAQQFHSMKGSYEGCQPCITKIGCRIKALVICDDKRRLGGQANTQIEHNLIALICPYRFYFRCCHLMRLSSCEAG